MKLIQTTSFLLLILSIIAAPLCSAKNKIKYYEPELTELTGTIKNLTFPGPPNYENVNNGDLEETCPYLILDHPIDARNKSKKSDNNSNNEAYNNVKVVQLSIMNDKLWKLMKDDAHVKVMGELFSMFTGHHHTRVLLGVKKASKLKKQKHAALKKIVWDDNNQITGVIEKAIKPSVKTKNASKKKTSKKAHHKKRKKKK